MNGAQIILALTGGVLVVAVLVALARASLHPGRYVVHRIAESHAPMLTGALVRSHRALPGRPSAASTAAPVYTITDLRAQPGARAGERRS